MNTDGVLVVFTAKTVGQILALGGTQSWVLNPQSMRNVGYVVCTRNDGREHDAECGPRTEPRNAAFVVGRVKGIRKVDNRNNRDRYLVEFSDYAEVMVPDFRAGTTRNPVTYSDIAQCQLNGIDIASLAFQPMPEPASTQVSTSGKAARPEGGLSINEAKKGLAIYFGVPAENVQITISG